jgi:hypothetical protein
MFRREFGDGGQTASHYDYTQMVNQVKLYLGLGGSKSDDLGSFLLFLEGARTYNPLQSQASQNDTEVLCRSAKTPQIGSTGESF